ncbi:MAG: metallophosphoesterase [Eubacteriales bacterium]|nr:metallophosphoesterase [Eubacteriales bacterium]
MKKMRDVIYRVWVDPKRYRLKRPVRMTLLADLHSNQIGRENKILIQRVIQFDPDLVLVAGDLIVGEAGSDTTTAQKLLGQLQKKYPIYYENGNHEHRMKIKPEIYGETYKEYRRWLLDRGIHFLENEREEIELCGIKIALYGLELSQEYFRRLAHGKKLTVQELEHYLGKKKQEEYAIVLAHNPIFFPVYAAWGADLVCSGHLHGGMVRIPGIGGIISPQMRPFPKYDRGRYKKEGSELIVSAGLGAHTIPFRPFNPIELVHIELTNEREMMDSQVKMIKWK